MGSVNRSNQSHFSVAPQAEIERSTFDRSHCHKTTFSSGYLIPIFRDMVLPGDTLNLQMTFFARMATLLKAPMDNLTASTYFFFVPWRQIWDNSKKFFGEQDNPADTTTYSIPQIVGPAAPGILSGSLSDYLGLPVGVADVTFNSFFHRCYNWIWNNHFRDENLQNSVTVDKDDGPDTYGDYVLLRRGKTFDYFTSALPWPQKNSAGAVTIPLGTTATVKTSSSRLVTGAQAKETMWSSSAGSAPGSDTFLGLQATSGELRSEAGTPTLLSSGWYPGNLYADLSSASSATINSLRQAFQLQKLYERDARGGTRYPEILIAHYGVTDPQSMVLQRPLYLGGGKTPINIHPVAGTNQVGSGATNQGNISAFATASGSNHGFTYSATEHGFVLGLVQVSADLTYQQGLPRMFSYRTRFDTYFPALAHIGEQSVLNKEIFFNNDANDNLVFGYQERYAEYRYFPSQITGLFRSNVSAGSTTIDTWHLAQNFASLPTLGTTFIQDTPPVSRIVAVTSEPQFLFDSYFKYICARPMPVYGVPGMIDRF